jgi:hypothetical protein
MGKFGMKISVNEMKTATFKGKQFAKCKTVLRSTKQTHMSVNLNIYKPIFVSP